MKRFETMILALAIFMIATLGTASAFGTTYTDDDMATYPDADYPYAVNLETIDNSDNLTWYVNVTNVNSVSTKEVALILSVDGTTPDVMYGINYESSAPYMKTYDSGWSAAMPVTNGVTVTEGSGVSYEINVPYQVLADMGYDTEGTIYYAFNVGVDDAFDGGMNQMRLPATFTSWTITDFASETLPELPVEIETLEGVADSTGNILNSRPDVEPILNSETDFTIKEFSDGTYALFNLTSMVMDNNGWDDIASMSYRILNRDTGAEIDNGTVSLDLSEINVSHANQNVLDSTIDEDGIYKLEVTVTDSNDASRTRAISQRFTTLPMYTFIYDTFERVRAGETTTSTINVTVNYGDSIQAVDLEFSDIEVYDNGNLVSTISGDLVQYTIPDTTINAGESLEIPVTLEIPIGTDMGTMESTCTVNYIKV